MSAGDVFPACDKLVHIVNLYCLQVLEGERAVHKSRLQVSGFVCVYASKVKLILLRGSKKLSKDSIKIKLDNRKTALSIPVCPGSCVAVCSDTN